MIIIIMMMMILIPLSKVTFSIIFSFYSQISLSVINFMCILNVTLIFTAQSIHLIILLIDVTVTFLLVQMLVALLIVSAVFMGVIYFLKKYFENTQKEIK